MLVRISLKRNKITGIPQLRKNYRSAVAGRKIRCKDKKAGIYSIKNSDIPVNCTHNIRKINILDFVYIG